jgi:hypothetical protein
MYGHAQLFTMVARRLFQQSCRGRVVTLRKRLGQRPQQQLYACEVSVSFYKVGEDGKGQAYHAERDLFRHALRVLHCKALHCLLD